MNKLKSFMFNYREAISIVAFLFLLFVGFLIGNVYQTSKVIPSAEVNSLSAFASKMPAPKEVIIFEKEGTTYIEVVGRKPSFPATPSGHPIYIFSQYGNLIYWNRDISDVEGYWGVWDKHDNPRIVTMQEAVAFTQQKH